MNDDMHAIYVQRPFYKAMIWLIMSGKLNHFNKNTQNIQYETPFAERIHWKDHSNVICVIKASKQLVNGSVICPLMLHRIILRLVFLEIPNILHHLTQFFHQFFLPISATSVRRPSNQRVFYVVIRKYTVNVNFNAKNAIKNSIAIII